jgi:hypothetical protein
VIPSSMIDNKHLRWLQSLENTDLFVDMNTRLHVLRPAMWRQNLDFSCASTGVSWDSLF